MILYKAEFLTGLDRIDVELIIVLVDQSGSVEHNFGRRVADLRWRRRRIYFLWVVNISIDNRQ